MRTIRSSSYQFSESTISSQSQVLTSLAVIVLVAVMEFFGLLQPLRIGSEWILVPVMQWSSGVVHTMELPYFVLRQSFQNYTYVQDIELRYAEAVAQLSELESLKKENLELRQFIGKTNSAEANKELVAPILAYGQPYIGKGQRDGVHTGDLVLIAQILIGRVNEVSESQASVTLFSSVSSLPILVQTESGVTGVLVGNGSQVIIKEIPQDAHLQVGERVTTVGQAEVPTGLAVGRIQSVSSSAVNSSQFAVVDQVVSFYQSRVVEVQQR